MAAQEKGGHRHEEGEHEGEAWVKSGVENLEEWVRGHVQRFIQDVLEQEVTRVFGARQGELEEVEPVHLWVDGVYVKAGLEKDKAALLVVLAALSDGSRVMLSVVAGHRESTTSWSEVLRI